MSKARPRAPDPEARRSILDAIDSAQAPVTVACLGKLPGIGNGARVKLLLAVDVAGGRVFDWGKFAYWYVDPETAARKRVLELTARECLSLLDLKRRVSVTSPKLSAKTVQSSVKKLIAEKQLLAKEPKASGIAGIIDLKHPAPYLERKIAAILRSVEMERSQDRIRALLAPEVDSPAAPQAIIMDVRDVAHKIFAVMNRIAFAPGATVTFQVLRQQQELAQIPKKVFDEAALLLQQEHLALLNTHGYAGSIPLHEKEQLVTDGFGNYYVSIYAR